MNLKIVVNTNYSCVVKGRYSGGVFGAIAASKSFTIIFVFDNKQK